MCFDKNDTCETLPVHKRFSKLYHTKNALRRHCNWQMRIFSLSSRCWIATTNQDKCAFLEIRRVFTANCCIHENQGAGIHVVCICKGACFINHISLPTEEKSCSVENDHLTWSMLCAIFPLVMPCLFCYVTWFGTLCPTRKWCWALFYHTTMLKMTKKCAHLLCWILFSLVSCIMYF